MEHSFYRGLFVTPPGAFAFYFEHWLAPPLLACAAVGVVAAFVERHAAARARARGRNGARARVERPA
ncbi:MAG: hypothetical protein DMG11_04450 [Acidobacteria bacterium]|nr:MAG: hypothetical protein DMG11_04450 [Acidobacteriota bacterium]